MSGRVFPILKDYQKFSGDKEGGFVTVDCSEFDGFEGLDKARINVPDIASLTIVPEGQYVTHRDELNSNVAPTTEQKETDAEAIDRIAARFSILDEMADAVATSKVRAMIVSGPPGIGKSYGVEKALERQNMFQDIAGEKRKFEMVKGAMSAIGLYQKLFKFSNRGHILVLDDCDSILFDDVALNILKAALDSSKKRYISWNTESRVLANEGVPDRFEFQGSVIMITNIKFDYVRSKKLQDHLQAIMSRCHYLDLTMDTIRDRMLRCKQVLEDGEMLKDHMFSKEKEQELIDFMWEHKESLNEISLRMITKIADLAKMSDDWKKLARVTCMKRSSAI